MTISQSDIDALLSSAGDLADTVEEGAGEQALERIEPEAPSAPAEPAPPLAPSPSTARPAGRSTEHPAELARIMQMKVPVIVTLAEREVSLKSVLAWTSGSIIEFDNPSDSELHLVITNKEIGLGHAVKVGENFGLRITRVGDLNERIQAMGGG